MLASSSAFGLLLCAYVSSFESLYLVSLLAGLRPLLDLALYLRVELNPDAVTAVTWLYKAINHNIEVNAAIAFGLFYLENSGDYYGSFVLMFTLVVHSLGTYMYRDPILEILDAKRTIEADSTTDSIPSQESELEDETM